MASSTTKKNPRVRRSVGSSMLTRSSYIHQQRLLLSPEHLALVVAAERDEMFFHVLSSGFSEQLKRVYGKECLRQMIDLMLDNLMPAAIRMEAAQLKVAAFEAVLAGGVPKGSPFAAPGESTGNPVENSLKKGGPQ